MTATETESGLTLLRNDICIPGREEPFVVADNFKKGEDNNGVPVGWLGPTFKQEFLPLVEENIKPLTAGRLHRLDRSGPDKQILSKLGGIRKAKVKLYYFHEFLKTADRSGWYIAYITNDLAIDAYYADAHKSDRNGWHVGAFSVDIPPLWLKGRLVFSGNLDL